MEENRFHYKDVENIIGFAQNKIITDVIQAEWFRSKTDVGVIFEDRFCPIPFELLALLMTLIEFCLDEYSNGTWTPAVFEEKHWKDKYEKHLVDVQEWSNLNPGVVAKIRKKILEQRQRQHLQAYLRKLVAGHNRN
ncbi:hypothetical protein SCP_1403060 [Sparassis crispa]|uniref:DUF6532 domain-containing protein n=1 Tax=Sparassis crispa TaxID=139825 RepID=A0A401H396_9APHY|nr:hypothetical protein SCP_1403060 [Sparassis crispa]GBE88898.1 hypothetical protein SCP_1403060 [Sparassis crispa]